MEVTLQVQLMGHTAHSIKPLSEADAVKSGAEILGEGKMAASSHPRHALVCALGQPVWAALVHIWL